MNTPRMLGTTRSMPSVFASWIEINFMLTMDSQYSHICPSMSTLIIASLCSSIAQT